MAHSGGCEGEPWTLLYIYFSIFFCEDAAKAEGYKEENLNRIPGSAQNFFGEPESISTPCENIMESNMLNSLGEKSEQMFLDTNENPYWREVISRAIWDWNQVCTQPLSSAVSNNPLILWKGPKTTMYNLAEPTNYTLQDKF